MTLLAFLLPIFLTRGPGPCESYTLQERTPYGWFARLVYANAALAPKVPNAGPLDTLYVSLSSAPKVSATFRCACVAHGDTSAFSPTLVRFPAQTWPDTTAAVWEGGRVHWVSAPGRLVLPAGTDVERVESQTALQRRYSRRMVELFGYWVDSQGNRLTEGVE